ncbi:LACT-domain-containing protein [Rhizopus microsporus var. microsporus]|uniref:LACT-domain-containing protein n=1 Tax=Rhizopus microsporus var. microsporus TaxID=86635 RepID=A0A1X0RH22_RHIZD|nr:LACT-domain-containing protein [Rhizopus microsporus var. microsporus]
MGKPRKRKQEKQIKVDNRELPEDIMADSAAIIFKEKRPFWSRKRFNFIVGLSVGLLAMYAASTTPAAQNHINSLQDYLLLQLADIDLPSILPATEIVDEFLGNFTNLIMPTPATEISFMPALQYKEKLNLKPHFPVVMIPGIVSSGLESWGTSERSRKYFRKRLWGTMAMIRSVLLDKESWTEHIMLDPETGLDPPGYKIRAVHGVEAADYFITGYWVWAKVIENLATVGYDTNNMHFASYDWRLSFSNLEVRDSYFTKLKNTIELSKKQTGLKAVVITHSMGGTMFPYFLKWVESKDHGQGGSTWVNDHVETFVNIAAPLMGVPKAVTSLLSGGEAIWGTKDSAPDDDEEEIYQSFGNMISFVPRPEGFNENSTDIPSSSRDPLIRNYTVDESLELLIKSTDVNFGKHLYANYSFGITTSQKQLKLNDRDPTKWSNPLESRLPNAPNMKIYCFYGIDVPTERSYYYAVMDDHADHDCTYPDNTTACTADQTPPKATVTETVSAPHPARTPLLHIDATVSNPVQRIETGIRFSDGDGTVPLLSLGYMCAPSGGWRKYADLYNPGHSPVVLREYKHELDILMIVSGQADNVTERIYSLIEDHAKKIKLT